MLARVEWLSFTVKPRDLSGGKFKCESDVIKTKQRSFNHLSVRRRYRHTDEPTSRVHTLTT